MVLQSARQQACTCKGATPDTVPEFPRLGARCTSLVRCLDRGKSLRPKAGHGTVRTPARFEPWLNPDW